MFVGERSMYWIEYKLFICLGSYSRSHIIRIKVGWFGLTFGSFNKIDSVIGEKSFSNFCKK